MAKQAFNNVKLGVFVLAGLLFLILLLYMIGRNRNLFGRNYVLKARFENIQGLIPGNNVRFAGIQAGTVKKIEILNDTLIEVTMFIDVDMKQVIRKNAIASIATDGLVGNRVVNIVPSKQPSPFAEDGDVIASKKMLNTDAMLDILNKTNSDIAVVAASLKETVQRINNSSALWNLLHDETVPENLRLSLLNIKAATAKANDFVNDLTILSTQLKNGEGTVGMLLTDSTMAHNLREAAVTIRKVSLAADSLALDITSVVSGIRTDVNQGNGAVHLLLKDTALVRKLNTSLDNIQQGTDGFNQSMEALQHHFLLRGYFRKQQKQRSRQ